MDAYLGEIRIFSGNFAPANWHLCDGALLPTGQYQALYSIIGVTYGGDGQTTFGLPDLRGRLPLGMGQGAGLSGRPIGATGGVEGVTLSNNQLPAHAHDLAQPQVKVTAVAGGSADLFATSAPGDSTKPEVGSRPMLGVPNTGGRDPEIYPCYKTEGSADVLLSNLAIQTLRPPAPEVAVQMPPATGIVGASQAHENMSPFLTINFIICLSGVFPAPGQAANQE